MDWDDIKYFLAVARSGSLAKAAKKLNVNHTTVSRRINALEKKLQVRLFERLHLGFSPTPAGEDVLPHAIAMEEAAQAIDFKTYGSDNRLTGKLILTAEANFANKMLIPHFSKFTAKYPDIQLEVITDSNLTDLNMREADIAVRITPNPPEDLIGRKICTVGHAVYASKQYLENFAASDNNQHQVVLWSHALQSNPWLDNNFSDYLVAGRFSSVGSMLVAVKNHMGIARLPCCIAGVESDLVRLPAILDKSTWAVWVLNHPQLRSTQRVRVFKKFLIDTLNQQKDLIACDKG
jgi:DNA-binding transcriptional LysR family regulator